MVKLSSVPKFTATSFQNSISIGQIEVSDGQVYPLERHH